MGEGDAVGGVGGVSNGRSPPSLPSVLLSLNLWLDSFMCVRIPSPSLFLDSLSLSVCLCVSVSVCLSVCLSVAVSVSVSLSRSQLITITSSSPVPPPVALFTVDEECFPYRIKRVL